METVGIIDAPAPVRRSRVAEAIDVIDHLWSGRDHHWAGDHHRIGPATGFLQPRPRPPLLVAGFAMAPGLPFSTRARPAFGLWFGAWILVAAGCASAPSGGEREASLGSLDAATAPLDRSNLGRATGPDPTDESGMGSTTITPIPCRSDVILRE